MKQPWQEVYEALRILFVMPYFYPAESFGGPVKVAFEVGKELVRRGHEVVVYTSDAKDLASRLPIKSAEVEGMQVHYFRNSSMFLVKNSKLFLTPAMSARMLSELKSFDVVHAHEYTTYQNIIVHKFATKYGIPYVLQAHGSFPKMSRQARKWLYDILFGSSLLKDASKVIALNQIEAYQCRLAGVPADKISVIPNGVDLSKYSSLPSHGFFKKKFNIRKDEKIILYLARIHKIKGVDILVKAFANVSEKLNGVRLVIVGPNDGFLGEVESLVGKLKLEGKVLIVGPLYGKDKLEAYVDADAYVLPSVYEMFPMSVLESVACGTPVILTENCGIAAYLRDKVGLVVKPDPNSLSKALLEILLNEEKQNRFRGNCKTLINEFSISKTASELEEVYETVVGGM